MGKYGAKKEEGSLRSLGVTTVPTDLPTKEKLRELAGEDTLSHTLRELVEKATQEKAKEAAGINQFVSLMMYLPAAAFLDFKDFDRIYQQEAGNLEALENAAVLAFRKAFQQARQLPLPTMEVRSSQDDVMAPR